MIFIFHGDNIATSRNAFINKRNEISSPVSLRGGEFTLTDLVQIFEGGELFSETKIIFIEDIFGKVKKGNELNAFTELLAKQASSHDIYLWESKTLTKQQLGLVPGANVQLFKLPTTLFSFLDALLPNNTTSLLSFAQKALADAGDEMLFAMIVRHIRILLAINEKSNIDETKRLAPWQKSKLEAQAKKFGSGKLLFLHSLLYQIDMRRKTGLSPTSLAHSIDFFILHI